MNKKFTIGIIVLNKFGVLNRVSGLFAKRCYNIDSLAVGVTENPEYSRMTIVSTGDEYMKQQVVKQLSKLHDVKAVSILDKKNAVSAEHMIIKMNANGESNKKITNIINSFGGKVMDFSNDSITAEITGSSEMINEFVERAKEIGILEVCRSGLISVVHGTESMLNIKALSN